METHLRACSEEKRHHVTTADGWGLALGPQLPRGLGAASGMNRSSNSGVFCFQGIAGSDGLPGDKGELVSVSTSPSLSLTMGNGLASVGTHLWRSAPLGGRAGPALSCGASGRRPGCGVLSSPPAKSLHLWPLA